jgi:hypothetical protein
MFLDYVGVKNKLKNIFLNKKHFKIQTLPTVFCMTSLHDCFLTNIFGHQR